jgi:very-short-patch-repair endonuclease
MNTQNLKPNVRDQLDDYSQRKREKLEEELCDIADLMNICESPLEQLLLLEFADTFDATPRGRKEDRHLRGTIVFPNVDRFGVAIRQQHTISTTRKDYRADFVITIEDWNWTEGRHEQLSKLVVEVDGHDYHERTKEQAEYDKSRDRSITTAGYTVLRFTGREVYRDASAVTSEIEAFLIQESLKHLA